MAARLEKIGKKLGKNIGDANPLYTKKQLCILGDGECFKEIIWVNNRGAVGANYRKKEVFCFSGNRTILLRI